MLLILIEFFIFVAGSLKVCSLATEEREYQSKILEKHSHQIFFILSLVINILSMIINYNSFNDNIINGIIFNS